MALLSTFDPGLKKKEMKYYCDKFVAKNVMVIHRSFLFLVLKFVLPLIVFLLSISVVLWSSEVIDRSGAVLTFFGLPLTVILVIVMVYRLSKVYIDYSMDFTIVTPEQIISYDQSFLLSRNTQTMQTSKIKTVSINKSGLLYSLFDNGDISFLSEGDQAHGEINLDWVKNPEGIKRRVLHIVDVARQLEGEYSRYSKTK